MSTVFPAPYKYSCTVLLQYLATAGMLAFKGGTCLAQVHGEFYRRSQDLDFVVPMPCEAKCAERRAQVAGVKKTIADLAERLGVSGVVEPLAGANPSTQDVAERSTSDP